MNPIHINAVAFQRDGLWIACCLEYHFVSCAESLEGLAKALLRQIIGQIEADLEAGHEPFFGYKPAPQKYWDMFVAAKAVSKPIKPRKSISQRWRELRDRTKVEAQLFPIVAAA